MQSHTSDEEMVGYLYRTLTDAKREMLDDHLTNCQECRSRLEHHQTRKRHVQNGLLAEINGRKPSPAMRFSAIFPRLRPRVPLATPFQPLFSGTVALVGVILAILGVFSSLSAWSFSATPTDNSPFSAIAGLLFSLAIVGQFDWKLTRPPSYIVAAVVAFLLWLGTAIIGLQTMVVIRDLFLLGVKWIGVSDLGAMPRSMLLIYVLALLWIALVIGGGEYHRRRVGQPNSWRLFGLTIGIELLVIVSGYWIFA